MNRSTLESRVLRLERQFKRHKNELFGIDNPSARDEAIFIDRLFSKYPTLKRELKQRNKQKGRHDLFNITLFTKGDHNGLKFVIGVNDGRGDMFCHAKDANDNVVAKFDPFNLDEDLNQVALFMLEQLENNDFSDKVDESVQLSSLDCEYIERLIKDSLNSIDDLKDLDVYVDVNDDNADYGFLNIGIILGDDELSVDYDVEVDEYNEFDLSSDDKKIGTYKSFNDVCSAIAKDCEKRWDG